MEDNALSLFDMAIREARNASEELDNYDHDSFNPENVVMFKGVRQEYVEAMQHVIALAVADPEELRRQLEALLRDH